MRNKIQNFSRAGRIEPMRMRLVLVLCAALALTVGVSTASAGGGAGVALPSVARSLTVGPMTIFNNLGVFPNTYACCGGWTVSGPQSAFNRFEAAMAFTPSQSAFVTRIDVALSHELGTNKATIELAQDSGGLPGAVIRTWSVANQPPFLSCCALTTINVSPLISVDAGKQYWLIATAGQNTWDTWNGNTIGQLGPVADNNFASGGWILSGSAATEGAFDVIGCKLCKVS
jgi:hypothetical protein